MKKERGVGLTIVGNKLEKLSKQMGEKQQHPMIPFEKFLENVAENPYPILRNIFHLFHDFTQYYLGKGVNEYPDDPETIGYVYYDCNKLFVEGADSPFFADRLFANKLAQAVGAFKRGTQQNKIYLFEGPHGSGKSTFLNNMLSKLEEYTKTPEGGVYETIWKLDKKQLGWSSTKLEDILQEREEHSKNKSGKNGAKHNHNSDYLEVPCPSHDYPIFMIPKEYRKEFLRDMIKDEKFKESLFNKKEYEWVFKRNPCTICTSLYQALFDKLGSPEEVFKMLFARKFVFNKRLGEGIGVFNAGDQMHPTNVITNEVIQSQLAEIFGDSNKVQYLYSRFAKTNNGVYALMDIKDNNVQRLTRLHGIISEGIHKVEDLEESVNSLFIAVINPEDKQGIETEKMKSFSDRLDYIKLPYVRDYNTEVEIYKSTFGKQIEDSFLPRVLLNFAKAIISSRLNTSSHALKTWISNPYVYNKYCDENLLLLKMDIYMGMIPPWLSEEHKKSFTARVRKKLILEESEEEGSGGFSGRESIALFDEFFSAYAKKGQLITMAHVTNFFSRDPVCKKLPRNFLESLKDSYNYTVLQEVKESMYYYNETKVASDIQNYLFAINFDIGKSNKIKCVYTGETLDVTEDFFKGIELRILGPNTTYQQREAFRDYTQKEYTSKTLAQEIQIEGKNIIDTELYKNLFNKYVYNLKENVLDPVKENDNFRNAIKDYGAKTFETYDKRIKEDVKYLIKNLQKKFGYTEEGARQVCIYVIDNNLVKKF